LGAGVLVMPYRSPVLAAKQLATVDVLSGGRLDLGVGAGWCQGGFEALGRGELFAERGGYTNEALEVMLRCWQGCEFGFQGRWTRFDQAAFEPIPVQRPRIPLWIGALATARLPLERAARFADIWHPAQLSPGELRKGSMHLNEMAG